MPWLGRWTLRKSTGPPSSQAGLDDLSSGSPASSPSRSRAATIVVGAFVGLGEQASAPVERVGLMAPATEGLLPDSSTDLVELGVGQFAQSDQGSATRAASGGEGGPQWPLRTPPLVCSSWPKANDWEHRSEPVAIGGLGAGRQGIEPWEWPLRCYRSWSAVVEAPVQLSFKEAQSACPPPQRAACTTIKGDR